MQARLKIDDDLGHAAVDVISNLRKAEGQLSTREQKVADFVSANLEKISSMTIAEVARACDVSSPTVVRFCRTMGCDGFREFKIRLAQNLAVSLQYLDVGDRAATETGAGVLDQVIGALSASLNVVRRQLDNDKFEAAKDHIANARTVLVGGIGGGSSIVAQEASNRLFRLGIATVAVSDSYLLQMRAATLSKSDVILLISSSGEADEVLSAAEIAGGYGATTIAITKSESTLSRSVECALQIDLPEDPDIYKPTASRYAYLVIIDALAMAIAQLRSDNTAENLRRIRASLTAYHGRTGPQPLGD
ncbi:MAG: MurR/RpiR family transcriptional regulator [Roseibium album]|uniref:Putative HTH-type transcriptional regulator YbbH n=2 Tax=Roseibium album TaxID=311410 RepID=A0A0M7ATN7_9HYPH|nr:MurR/RpiR family transcriptional regulator [Roseibium album]MBG6202370.1 DNA-binding MurR/RpiR family transcriptional regulator [Labrenzia sp. EL_13]MBG6208274.1 DNA-binding MurR/RpiR family transcriptional regulator [Labrenzia sp. EL_126]CTQ59912.1 putative HTH-type transcriptional regulator YbbH [Roseibium album]CTQ76724.1 putative HTH-type transcriptional regulator YbbH [Roseibium album]CTQ77143.1 putative HTH-type transcriptional regulator YbbH [Roseibium album]